MSDKVRKEKISDARIFYIGLIAAVAVVQIVLKVFTTLVPDVQSQVLSRITEGIMLIFAVMFALRTTFVQPWFGLKIETTEDECADDDADDDLYCGVDISLTGLVLKCGLCADNEFVCLVLRLAEEILDLVHVF